MYALSKKRPQIQGMKNLIGPQKDNHTHLLYTHDTSTSAQKMSSVTSNKTPHSSVLKLPHHRCTPLPTSHRKYVKNLPFCS